MIQPVNTSYKTMMWELAERLFPIHRSILGSGYQQSLNIINEYIPIETLTYTTGTQCGSWVIPQEWQVEEAYIEDISGNRVIDYATSSNLQICQRSIPFEGVVSREELLEHCYWREDIDPEAIPCLISYYKPFWGFALSQNQFKTLNDQQYKVVIRTKFYDGHLRVGQSYLEGESKEEIIIDSYLCHPSIGNDNISGVVVATALLHLLRALPKRRYSYRLLFPPETIGPIVYFHQNKHVRENVVGGITLVCVGDSGPSYHFRKSRGGETIIDRAMQHSLKHSGFPHTVENFTVVTGTSGNEKAYNSLGIEMPVSSLRRSTIGTYPEHLTSKDNLDLIRPENLMNTLEIVWGALFAAEHNVVYQHQYVGEPFLTGLGIYPVMQKHSDRIAWDFLLAFADGKHSLLDIAEKANVPITDFDTPVQMLCEKRQLKRHS